MICPTGSIAMQADEKGFLYPYIHATTCCQCGKCTHVCPVLHAASVWQTQSNAPKVYAMIDKLAKIGLIHKNKASNLKSGIAVHINKLA